MEVMQWEALLKSVRRRCENTNTGSCWLAPDTKEGKNDRDDIPIIFAKEKALRRDQKTRCLFYPWLSCKFYETTPTARTMQGLGCSTRSYPFPIAPYIL